jgi:hypothetical protein
MTVNQLINQLNKLKKDGHGGVHVHMLAHDNVLGESQGEVCFVNHFEKDEYDEFGGDLDLYKSLPNEVVYLHS